MKHFYKAKETGKQAVQFGDLFNSFDERCGDFLEWFIEERQEDRTELLSGFDGTEEDEWNELFDRLEKKYSGKWFELCPPYGGQPPYRLYPPHISLNVLDQDEVEEDI